MYVCVCVCVRVCVCEATPTSLQQMCSRDCQKDYGVNDLIASRPKRLIKHYEMQKQTLQNVLFIGIEPKARDVVHELLTQSVKLAQQSLIQRRRHGRERKRGTRLLTGDARVGVEKSLDDVGTARTDHRMDLMECMQRVKR